MKKSCKSEERRDGKGRRKRSLRGGGVERDAGEKEGYVEGGGGGERKGRTEEKEGNTDLTRLIRRCSQAWWWWLGLVSSLCGGLVGCWITWFAS